MLGIAIALIFVAAGFHGAWRTGRVRTGTLVAMATSVIGSLITIVVLGLGSTPSFDLQHANGPGQVFGQNGGQVTLMLLMLCTVPGTVGAMFGGGLGGLRRRRNCSRDLSRDSDPLRRSEGQWRFVNSDGGPQGRSEKR